MGSVPSEMKWSYPAEEMGKFYEMLGVEDFRKAPYWKYCSVLKTSDVDSLPLYGTTLKPYGMSLMLL